MRTMSDSRADLFLIFALLAWGIGCVHPAIGMLVQFPLIIVLVWKCDIKALPSLLLLMLSKSNVRALNSDDLVLRVGITLSQSSLLIIVLFFFTIRELMRNAYDRPTTGFAWIWLSSLIPALIISFVAKRQGLGGLWSGPIMDFLAPSMYFWAVSMGRTFDAGRYYFCTRMVVLLFVWNLFTLLPVFYVFTLIPPALAVTLTLYMWSDRRYRNWNLFGFLNITLSVLVIIFARAITLKFGNVDISAADEHGSTFSGMAIFAIALWLALTMGRTLPKAFARMLPILMVVANVLLVSFVISTQAGNEAKDVTFKYETYEERFKWKLFGDRGAVWTDGWNDLKTPPYVFTDLRKFLVTDYFGETRAKILPHNQYLTLLSRRGLWLGLVLSIFIIWVQVRAFRIATYCPMDRFVQVVMIPVGAAIFCVVGTTGQSVASGSLWGNGLATMVMPGIVYGYWIWRQNMAQRFSGTWM